ncbi:MAG: thrombospondin type 3 repeat-containing protein, partial [Phycisphaerae bacterium]
MTHSGKTWVVLPVLVLSVFLAGQAGPCGGTRPSDRDGDGVADAGDNCPDIVNADQADADGDGIGDACEPPPVDAGPAFIEVPDPLSGDNPRYPVTPVPAPAPGQAVM